MKHEEFQIGCEFRCGGKIWICTDVGSRVTTAIEKNEEDESWHNGPPYALAETVFDEFDMEACELIRTEYETRNRRTVKNDS